jgi:hypothetical protein
MSSLKDKVPLWFQEFAQMTQKDRVNVVSETLTALSKFNSTDDKPTKAGIAFLEFLNRDCVLQGLSYEYCYTMARGSEKDLQSLFIHKFGLPTLVYHHRIMPILIVANPAIRKDKMVLAEIPGNSSIFKHVYTVGTTG